MAWKYMRKFNEFLDMRLCVERDSASSMSYRYASTVSVCIMRANINAKYAWYFDL